MGIRIKPKNELWFLKVNNRIVLEIPTKTKGERCLLNQIRNALLNNEIDTEKLNLTNRGEITIKIRKRTQEQIQKQKDNSKFIEYKCNKSLSEITEKDRENFKRYLYRQASYNH